MLAHSILNTSQIISYHNRYVSSAKIFATLHTCNTRSDRRQPGVSIYTHIHILLHLSSYRKIHHRINRKVGKPHHRTASTGEQDKWRRTKAATKKTAHSLSCHKRLQVRNCPTTCGAVHVRDHETLHELSAFVYKSHQREGNIFHICTL